LAIREVYDDAARTGHTPCESYLRETLVRLASQEQAHDQGSAENVAVYRNLALALGDYCADGLYAHLLDRPTQAGSADAPLVVFNTTRVPDELLPAVNFCALELIDRRVEARNRAKLQKIAAGWTPAGPFDMASVVVAEEVWKTVSRKATAGWLIEKAKRARHVGLWFVLITQQHSDLANEHGRALLDNATIQLHLRQRAEELDHIAGRLKLGPEEVTQIAQLVTEKGAYAQAYLLNGARGRGKLRITVGPHLYWLATSDPHRDIPLRERALAQTGGEPWPALDLLADPAWQHQHDEGGGV
jgi:type IV secretory pathway VirB4 component